MKNLEKKYLYKELVVKNIVIVSIFILLAFVFSGGNREESLQVSLPVVPPNALLGSSETKERSEPVKMFVPKIGINARTQKVGITAGGNMAVPDSYTDVGWFRLGAEPGAPGSAVVAGHLDTGSGKPAVFYRLGELEIGDEIFVKNQEGETLKFVVTGSRLVDYDNPPAEVIEELFGKPKDENSYLNLITCDGDWIPEEKTYNTRLIVFSKFAGVVVE